MFMNVCVCVHAYVRECVEKKQLCCHQMYIRLRLYTTFSYYYISLKITRLVLCLLGTS